MSPWKAALAAVSLLCAPAWAAEGADPHAHHRQHAATEEKLDPPSTDSIFNLSSTFTTSEGKRLPFKALRGKPMAVAMMLMAPAGASALPSGAWCVGSA